MLRVATAFRDLPLRAAAYPSRGSDAATMMDVVAFEPEDLVTLSSAMVGLFNAQGRLVTPREPERADLTNRPVIAGLVAPAGIYRMRVAAIDASGRSGTVDDEVRVGLAAAGPAQLSAPVLGIPGAGSFAPRRAPGSPRRSSCGHRRPARCSPMHRRAAFRGRCGSCCADASPDSI